MSLRLEPVTATEERRKRGLPKRKKSRSNTRHRRPAGKAELPTLVKSTEGGKSVYRLPHRASVVEDSLGTPLLLDDKGRQVADV